MNFHKKSAPLLVLIGTSLLTLNSSSAATPNLSTLNFTCESSVVQQKSASIDFLIQFPANVSGSDFKNINVAVKRPDLLDYSGLMKKKNGNYYPESVYTLPNNNHPVLRLNQLNNRMNPIAVWAPGQGIDGKTESNYSAYQSAVTKTLGNRLVFTFKIQEKNYAQPTTLTVTLSHPNRFKRDNPKRAEGIQYQRTWKSMKLSIQKSKDGIDNRYLDEFTKAGDRTGTCSEYQIYF